ncbi:MAG: ATP-grasp domain-containing protein [Candidatus Omnitrophica bacterium]|nr:ATP-grasp domain-containing protein [Candidatus Omnitrophota bacterium]
MRKKLNILLLFDSPYSKPRGYDYAEEFQSSDWEAESDVSKALCALGHKVRLLGLYNDIIPLIEEIKSEKADVVFNLAEVFNQKSHLEKNIVCVLEMLGVIQTGASAASLFICNDKALTKKILNFHRIKVPQFHTFYRGHRIWLPKTLKLPLVVKPLCEEASRGIAQASVTDSEESFCERVRFIHETMKHDAIAEEYIDGRELYVGVFGNKRITVLPPTEIKFGTMSEDEPRIATYKAKWDNQYRKKWGIRNVFSARLAHGVEEKVKDTCERAYRALNMRCYARFDVRMTAENQVFIIEANANPSIGRYEDFAMAAEKIGISYQKLMQRIIDLAFRR